MNTRTVSFAIKYALAAAAALPFCFSSAQATVKFIPHVAVNYEDNSNLFAADQVPRNDPDGQPRFGDTYRYYSGGLDLTGTFGEEKLGITSEIRRYRYDHFIQLNRDDKLFGLALDWVATGKIFGQLTGRYDEHQTPYTEIIDVFNNPNQQSGNSNLVQIDFRDVERDVGLATNYRMTSKLLATLNLGYSRKSGPLNTSQRYDLQQAPASFSLRYGVLTKLTLGASAATNKGKYIQGGDAPTITSTQYTGLIDYTFSPRTSFGGSWGIGKYKQFGLESKSNIGNASFNQQLTDKTKYFIRYDRTYDFYTVTQGFQVNSTTTAGLTWQATRRLAFSGDYAVTDAEVQAGFAAGVFGVFGDTRKDKIKTSQVRMNYDVLKWLSISPYYTFQERSSDAPGYNYRSRIIGATLTAKYQ
ncbi:MAG: hypothetical protein QM808_13395 [Steroidobacteraceae bacterium]